MSTKILVTSEIASWVVNGVNTSFTTSKLISSINTIVVNGSEYAQYSFSWTTIVLDDAPSAWSVLVTYSYESNYDFLDNSWWITWEVMTWTVDGTNKVFSAFYPISLIDEVRVNWIVVGWYTILWNTILLASAPVTGYVEIDYFRKDLLITDYSRDRYYTKKEVRDMVYAEIGQDDTSVQYPKTLVDLSVSDWVSEAVSQVQDKSRFLSYRIDAPWYINVSPIANSISTFGITNTKTLPPTWRLVSYEDGSTIDYSTISSSKIMSSSSYSRLPTTSEKYYVGYRLPRNIKRIVSVTYDKWSQSQTSWLSSDFLFWNWLYYINNGFLYLKYNAVYMIEIEVDEYATWSDDNSLIYVDKEDVWVIVYYALRQLYQSRESDKLQMVSQLFTDKLRAYKRRMRLKRTNDKWNLMKTSSGLIPWNRFNMTRIPDTILVPQIIIKPSDSIDGWYSNN